MTDIVTYCDVNNCTECPRYGDDCDGSAERLYTHEEAWRMCDLISRADAIKAVASITMSIHLSDVICDKLLALPSADAKPTVIRSKTLLPTKDFKEWAKRVRETNPNVIVIPCDAEVVSADAVQGEWKHTITAQPYCSNCEYVFGEEEEFSPFWNYCPMCGARMKGGAE